MSGLQLDFVIYLGDPDEGAEALDSASVLKNADAYSEDLEFPGAYGALTLARGDDALLDPLPDPIFGLVTNLVRSVSFIIEGEAENQRWSESEHGLSIVPNNDDVILSVFEGDPFEPDEYLVQEEEMSIIDFGEQVVTLGERLEGILKKVDADALAEDDYLKGLPEFLELAREAVKTYRLEKERGLRV